MAFVALLLLGLAACGDEGTGADETVTATETATDEATEAQSPAGQETGAAGDFNRVRLF